MMKTNRHLVRAVLLLLITVRISEAQYFFSSGVISLCDTSIFTANVGGIGVLEPQGIGWGFSLNTVCIDIISNHPEKLTITLTSPMGTTLLLSAFNGTGGSNYTGCCFNYNTYPNITTGSAPFAGNWTAQGGSLSIFTGENADGIWAITIIDTSCQGGGGGNGGNGVDTAGWFDGGAGGGSAGFGFAANTPPCLGSIPSGQADICQGDSVDIMAFYTSFDPSLFYTVMASNPNAVTVSGSYQVQGMTWWPVCFYNTLFTVNVHPKASLGPDQFITQCNNTPVNLNSLFTLTGSNALWSLNGSPISSATVSAATSPGVYQVIDQTPFGCNDTAEVTLNIVPGVSLGPDQNIVECYVGSFDLTTLYNTSGLTSMWYLSGNMVSNPAAATVNGTYMLIATDANGCSDTVYTSLNVSPAPSLGPDQAIAVCSNTFPDLTQLFNTSGYTANWTLNGLPVANPASVNTAGTYTLLAIAANGCTDTAEVALSILQAPALGPDQSHAVCSNGRLDLTTLYNTTGYTTSWMYNGAAVANPASVAATGTYTILVTDTNSCTDTADVILNHLPAPVLGPDQSYSVCTNLSIDLTLLYNNPGYTSNWFFNGSPVVNPDSVNTGGSYTLFAMASNGCSDTAEVTLSSLQAPVLGPDQSHTICSNTFMDLTMLYQTTGCVSNWMLNGLPVNNPSFAGLAGTYQLIATNSSGCTDSASVSITLKPSPNLGPDQAIQLCSGSKADLTGMFSLAGLTTLWTEGGNPVIDPTAIYASGNYQLIATSANGCTDTAMVTVSLLSNPVLGIDQSVALCPWMTLNLGTMYTNSGFTTTYFFNGGNLANITAVHDSGTYTVLVTDINGCTDEALVFVTHIDCDCLADFRYSAKCLEDPATFELIADSDVVGARWIYGNSLLPDQFGTNASVKLLNEDSMLVTLEASLSCGTILVKKYVQVESCSDSCCIYFPNAFTPNDDGRNDQFTWYGECPLEEYLLEIHNRYGQVVFRTNNPDVAWDGISGNVKAPSGVYVYHAEYRLFYQDKKSITGRITLLR